MYGLRSEINRNSGSALKDCEASKPCELFSGLEKTTQATTQAMKPNAKAAAKVQGSRTMASSFCDCLMLKGNQRSSGYSQNREPSVLCLGRTKSRRKCRDAIGISSPRTTALMQQQKQQ
jgi:hypothetical protein